MAIIIENKGVGKVVQVVENVVSTSAATTTTMPLDDTIPQNTEGAEFYTLAITPTNSNNTLVITVHFFHTCQTTVSGVAALFQDSTVGALSSVGVTGTVNFSRIASFTHTMAAGTTSSTTFKVRAGPASAATLRMNGDANAAARFLGGVASSSIVITELSA